MQKYIQIGYTKKTYGVDGILKMHIELPYEATAYEAGHFYLEINGRYLPYFIEGIELGGDALIKFEEVNSKEVATSLTSKGIYVLEKDLILVNEDAITTNDSMQYAYLQGYILQDETVGEVGEILEVLEFPQQEMASVTYKEKEVLIPLSEGLINEIIKTEKKIIMSLPEGLLDL